MVDVELDAEYLTGLLMAGNSGDDGSTTSDEPKSSHIKKLAVQKAKIRRLVIHLSLTDNHHHNTTTNSNGEQLAAASTARKATSALLRNIFGSFDENSSSIALVVHVELDGIQIDLAPMLPSCNNTHHFQTTSSGNNKQSQSSTASSSPVEQDESTPGFFSSLVDSALKSLRLSIDISNVNIRFISHDKWVALQLASVRYYDLILDNKNDSTDSARANEAEKRVLSKGIDWHGLCIQTCQLDMKSNTLLQSTGEGHVKFCFYESLPNKNVNDNELPITSGRREIDVSLGQHVAVTVDNCALQQLVAISNAFVATSSAYQELAVDANDFEDPAEYKTPKFSLADEFTREAYDEVMKQYTEARHLARTREVRGGILIPSFDNNNDDDWTSGDNISFDAFFDANDHSVSHYCDLMEDSWSAGNANAASNGGQHVHRVSTKVDFSISEFTMKLGFDGSSESMTSESILLSIGDFQFIVFESDNERKINSSISHFDIESQLLVNQSIVTEPMLQFLDQAEEFASMTVSRPPCISVYAEFSNSNERNVCQLDLVLQPLEVVYRHRAIDHLTNMNTIMNETKSQSAETKSNEKITLHISLSCESVALMFPCAVITHADPLFARCGYTDQDERMHPFLGLGVEIRDLSTDVSIKTNEDMKLVTKLSTAVLYAKSTQLESTRKGRRRFASSSYVSRRTDIMACAADQDRACDSSIMLSFTQFTHDETEQRVKRKSTFPMVLPLSSMKACQEDDDSDADQDLFDNSMQSPRSEIDPISTFKTTDPQYIMSSEASEARREVVLNIPHVFLDLTSDERNEIINILVDISSQGAKSEDTPNSSCRSDGTMQLEKEKRWSCVALNVGQLSAVLYGNENISSSYSLVLDHMQVHTLIDESSGVRNIRLSSADITLYQLASFDSLNDFQQGDTAPNPGEGRCMRIQKRFILKERFSHSKVIFFRSKLSKPLSPEYPAILVDLILRKNNMDDSIFGSPSDQLDERSIHVSMYDLTYRYSAASEWISDLTALARGQCSDEKSQLRSTTNQDENSVSSLTNLFVNMTDCNFDYTTPMNYTTASRTVLRIREIQLSSNILTPSPQVQAYKVSLSELEAYICNYRRSHNEENTLISCAHRHLREESLSISKSLMHATERTISNFASTLSQMDFINVFTLDSLDAGVSLTLNSDSNRSHDDPATTIAVTLGIVDGNFCKDSFVCFADTLNEWLIRTTALSEDELEKLRSASELKSQLEQEAVHKSANGSENLHTRSTNNSATPILSTSNSTQPSSIFRDDSATLDLTKTLLYENYYTIDAKNAFNVAKEQQVQHQPITVVESVSSDDEWAAIEHEYLRNSNVHDHRAEWIMPDFGTRQQLSESQSQAIKVFPQHFSAKPSTDPVGGKIIDAVKLRGMEVTPKVALRLIVKDASISCHFFDGLDWASRVPIRKAKVVVNDRKRILLDGLLEKEVQSSSSLLKVPDHQSEMFQRETTPKRTRNVHRYFSVSIEGVELNNDSYVNSTEHQLASYLNLSVSDFFVAESISDKDPVKMIGEWINEAEHPRDDSDGVIMLKMITNHPTLRVSADGKLMSDESEATLELLPLRCFFHQQTIRFIRGFFAQDAEAVEDNDVADEVIVGQNEMPEVVPVFFTSFKVAPAKLKVDYTPEKIDVDSFREGNYVEILNLCPLEDMVLTLQEVENQDLTGWGSVFSELASRWIDDVGKTQSHKFFTRATPVQFFSGITEGAADLAMVLVVPESDSFADYLKDVLYSSTLFASKLACETLTTTAKLTKYAANQLSSKDLLPRPKSVPRHVGDAAGHSVESISRGLRAANYKIVTVPLREYQQSGASGAARSAVKGIPIAVLAPLSGETIIISALPELIMAQ